MAKLERNSREWFEEWDRVLPLLEEWKKTENPALIGRINESLEKLGIVVPIKQ